jgi:hypothetical protein
MIRYPLVLSGLDIRVSPDVQYGLPYCGLKAGFKHLMSRFTRAYTTRRDVYDECKPCNDRRAGDEHSMKSEFAASIYKSRCACS